MSFRKYNSIENSYREKTLAIICEMPFMEISNRWTITEKIHGANFSIGIEEDDSIWFASRNGVLAPDDNFYGYHAIKDELIEKIKKLKSCLSCSERIIVYGEIFGGYYNHPDVPKQNVKRVQKGIQYSPKLEFYTFDLFLNNAYVAGYLDSGMREEAGFLCAKILFEGTLDECLAYPNDFESKLPKQLGLPEIKNNMCEGVVIKPLFDQYLSSGSRVILKNKNKKWSETGEHKKKKVKISLTTSQDRMLTYLIAYVNENRYDAVVSKMGEIDYSDTSLIGKLIPALREDVLEDFWKDYGDKFLKDDLKFVNKEFTKEVRNLVLRKF